MIHESEGAVRGMWGLLQNVHTPGFTDSAERRRHLPYSSAMLPIITQKKEGSAVPPDTQLYRTSTHQGSSILSVGEKARGESTRLHARCRKKH